MVQVSLLAAAKLALRAAAEWLDPALKDAADTVSNGAALIPVAVRWHWFGESADAYVSSLSDLGDAADEIVPLASDAAEKLRSYAGQLERMRDAFAGHREKASGAGIAVQGMVIQRPVSLVPVCPASRDDPYGSFEHAAALAGAWGAALTAIVRRSCGSCCIR